MSRIEWTDQDLERHLRSLEPHTVFPGLPKLSSGLLQRTRQRWQRSRFPGALRFAAAATLASLFLLLLPGVSGTLAEMGEMILGIRVKVLNMSREEWLKVGFSDWLASPGSPEFLSPEETARIAPFPIRTPRWLPEGYAPLDEPRGAYPWVHTQGAGWQVSEEIEHFFVSQTYQDQGEEPKGEPISILQTVQLVRQEVDLQPATEIVEAGGHPAFLRLDLPLALADKENEERSRRGELPEVVGHWNQLEIWVEEEDGQITQLLLSGKVDPETLLRVAESLF